MKYVDFKAIMDEIKLPHTYFSYPQKNVPNLPYFVWYFEGTENFGADNVVYAEIVSPTIELYTREKSFEDEAEIEAVLNKYGFFWNKSDTYIDSERMFMILYEIGDFIHGE